MAYEPNFMDLLTAGTDDEARAQARVMAEQLRGDKTLGLMALGGGRLAAPIGKEMLADTDQGEKGLLTAGVNRLHYGQQAQDLKRAKMAADFDKAMAVQLAKNEGSDAVMKARMEGMYGIAQLKALAGDPDAKEKAASMKDLAAFTKTVNPLLQSSRSGIGSSGIINLRGSRVMRLFTDTSDDALDKVPRPLVNEAIQGVASMVNGGYAPTVTAIHELAPKTIGMNAADMIGYITNDIPPANQAKFLKALIGVVDRENKHAKAVQASNFFTQINAYPRVVQHHGDKVKNIARSLGIAEYMDEDGNPKPGVIEALAEKRLPEEMVPAAAADPFAEAKAWLAANPKDPRAPGVAAKIQAGGK
jgi:hypothetical protein